ncbi:BadM/Rrf2 family transcriptional regulator, partial [Mesorhizobium sp. M7A.F.Ca.CA.001.12.2.1]
GMFGEAIASFQSTLDRYTLAAIMLAPKDFLGSPKRPAGNGAAHNVS